ncbi:MAG TPA: VCBS repeat-containing protein, partial [Pyrinomonadaceae bacterium]
MKHQTSQFLKFFFSFVLVISAPVFGSAQAKTVSASDSSLAPANDNFANAEQIPMPNPAFVTTQGDVYQAGSEPGEPQHAEKPGGASLWYKITPTETCVMRFLTSNSNFNTLLAVYTGASVDNLTVVGFNDNRYALTNDSQLEVMLTGGQTYYIAVDSFGGIQNPAPHTFSLTAAKFNAPGNDNFAAPYLIAQDTEGNYSGTNYNATKEANEPLIYTSNPNGKSVWFKWTPSISYSATFEITENFNSQIGVYTSASANPTLSQLSRIANNADLNGYAPNRHQATVFAEAGKTYWILVDWHTGGQDIETGNFQLKLARNKFRYSSRLYDHTTKTAVSVFRPSEGVWHDMRDIIQTGLSRTVKFGQNGDVPVAADYDGDGVADHAVARNENGKKMWYILRSDNLGFEAIQWGLSGDRALVGDFDGDGRGDLVAVRSTLQGYVWYIRQSTNGALRAHQFGALGDRLALGDYDGDRMTDLTAIRNAGGKLVWYISTNPTNAPNNVQAINFGLSSDAAVVEDYYNDGKTDVAVYRAGEMSYWYILRSSDGQFQEIQFGASGDKPQPGDYNGDGKTDVAVFRPSTGSWYIAKPTGVPAQNFYSIQWGAA